MANQPLIIDTSTINIKIPPIDPQHRQEWLTNGQGCLHPDMDQLFSWIESNYQIVATIEPHQEPIQWIVYKWKTTK